MTDSFQNVSNQVDTIVEETILQQNYALERILEQNSVLEITHNDSNGVRFMIKPIECEK